MAMWIQKDYDSPTHEIASWRERVIVKGEYRWQAKTLCGRTITGHSGGTAFQVDCKRCRSSADKLERDS